MSEDTRVIINAGGKLFETSTTTLLASGSGYFEGLLGSTGETMRGKKRARISADGDDDAASRRELFVDRDPEVFGDLLKYMRGNRLPAAVRADAHRLDDLKAEAEFFAYDRLVAACDEAMAALSEKSEEHARCVSGVVEAPEIGDDEEDDEDFEDQWGEDFEYSVPKGQVMYITQISPYLSNARSWKLRAQWGSHDETRATIGRYYQPTNRTKDYSGQMISLTQNNVNLVLDGGEDETVRFDACGACWNFTAWIGHPSKIPGLGARTN